MNHLLLFSVIIQEIEKMIVQNPDVLHIENHCGLGLSDQITRAPATSQCSNKFQQWPGWWFRIFFMFTPYLGKIPILTNIFQMGWNHQPVTKTLVFRCRGFYHPVIRGLLEAITRIPYQSTSVSNRTVSKNNTLSIWIGKVHELCSNWLRCFLSNSWW